MKCPVCSSDNIIYDQERGQSICSSCGYVLEDNIIDQGPEWRAYTQQDKMERERTGSPLTFKVHDQGLSTKIGSGRVKDRIRLLKMRKLQDKIRVSSKDKKLVTFLSELNNEASKLGLPDHVKETAAYIIRRLVETGFARRIDRTTLVIAALYFSCQVNGIPKHLQELRSKYSVSQSEFWKALQRVQRVSKQSQNLKPKIRPGEYIPNIVDKLRLPQPIATKAAEIVDVMYKSGLTSGKGYLALSAATVYLVSTLMDVKKTQKEVAEVLGISEVTIRNRYKEIIKNFDITITL
ncbi:MULTISPECIES: transcription initiation factor IIB family protein [Acidianus]|uniref:Transcription initiation factor IIB 2 n=1 Tax=Candidatus Acidianus copahuensis TaxID=1160895 RepID=A0A031LQW7_9CREN|nr:MULTISPECIES: transcription initiation factor IIB family protein [Acidianus]EZQ06804.1 transcription initiation factor IIB 2 [Candidatus Acidianus copahuensis]NON61815.1 transcription initiation factor IIB family protein [Acidianus sp. RZ1]